MFLMQKVAMSDICMLATKHSPQWNHHEEVAVNSRVWLGVFLVVFVAQITRRFCI
jgi:hypothetical protein